MKDVSSIPSSCDIIVLKSTEGLKVSPDFQEMLVLDKKKKVKKL